MNACPHRSPLVFRMVRGASWTIAWLLALGCAAWAFGALHYDFPMLHDAAAWAFALALLAAIVFMRGAWRKLGATFFGCALVLAWWLTLKPSNTRAWQPDVAQEPWAEVKGDEVTLHNVRNFDYRTETDYTPRWETRTVRLSQTHRDRPRDQLLGLAVDRAHDPELGPFTDEPAPRRLDRDAQGGRRDVLAGRGVLPAVRALLRRRRRARRDRAAGPTTVRARTSTCTAPWHRRRKRASGSWRLHRRARMNSVRTRAGTTPRRPTARRASRTQQAATQRAPWDGRILLNGKRRRTDAVRARRAGHRRPAVCRV